MLHENSIMEIGNSIVFMNPFALTEAYELLNKMINNMAEDLSVITGISKEEIIYDYRNISDYDPIREVLKQKGKWNEEMDKSLALIVMEKKINNLNNKEN